MGWMDGWMPVDLEATYFAFLGRVFVSLPLSSHLGAILIVGVDLTIARRHMGDGDGTSYRRGEDVELRGFLDYLGTYRR